MQITSWTQLLLIWEEAFLQEAEISSPYWTVKKQTKKNPKAKQTNKQKMLLKTKTRITKYVLKETLVRDYLTQL